MQQSLTCVWYSRRLRKDLLLNKATTVQDTAYQIVTMKKQTKSFVLELHIEDQPYNEPNYFGRKEFFKKAKFAIMYRTNFQVVFPCLGQNQVRNRIQNYAQKWILPFQFLPFKPSSWSSRLFTEPHSVDIWEIFVWLLSHDRVNNLSSFVIIIKISVINIELFVKILAAAGRPEIKSNLTKRSIETKRLLKQIRKLKFYTASIQS